MGKILTLIVALIAVGCATEPVPRNLDTLVQQGDLYLESETMTPYSGPVFKEADDDSRKVVFQAVLKNGEFHGPFVDYDPESFRDRASLGIYQEGEYRNGLKEARYAYFYPSGIILGEASYTLGLRDGSYTSWYESGELRSEWAYSNGERDGPYVFYHEDGQLREKGVMSAGERCGQWIEDGETVSHHPC